MKIRNGFVSNSSSSSFIVKFPDDFELTEENVFKFFYGDSEKTVHEEKLINFLFEKMKREGDVTSKPSSESTLDVGVEWSEFTFNGTFNQSAYDLMHQVKFNEMIEKKFGSLKNVYEFYLGDDSGGGAGAIEAELHDGDIFEGVPHIYINCH